MSIDWVSVDERVPCDRKPVIVWIKPTGPMALLVKGHGSISRFNRCTKHRGLFDCEKGFSVLGGCVVSHWAEIEPPKGRTTQAMLAAPPGAYYVWCNTHLNYPIGLAKSLGRTDLVIVAPSWLNHRNIMTHERIEVVIDHATMLDTKGYQALQEIELRKKTRGPTSA